MQFAFIFLFGGLGACLRFLTSKIVFGILNLSWPATAIVNLVGCLLIFLLHEKINLGQYNGPFRFGLIGALTTFSTFAYELVTLSKDGRYSEAIIVFFLNIFGGILIGIWILR